MKMLFKHAMNYPVLKYTTWSQSLGATLLVLIVLQIFTGILLDLSYDPTIEGAAHSMWFIETHTYNGWFVSQWHVIGTNLLFILLYMHIFSGLHYSLFEWKLRKTWWSGYIMYVAVMATAFLGYVLPWGQMSYWGAKVIISMTSGIPFMGSWLTTFLWGGPTPTETMLSSVLWLHTFVPGVIVVLIFLHLYFIHKQGAHAGLCGIFSSFGFLHYPVVGLHDTAYQRFWPDYILKDALTLIPVLWVGLVMMWVDPYFFHNPINARSPEFGVVPKHMAPEWYFLPFYGVVKFFPNANYGTFFMFFFMIMPFFFPFLTQYM